MKAAGSEVKWVEETRRAVVPDRTSQELKERRKQMRAGRKEEGREQDPNNTRGQFGNKTRTRTRTRT